MSKYLYETPSKELIIEDVYNDHFRDNTKCLCKANSWIDVIKAIGIENIEFYFPNIQCVFGDGYHLVDVHKLLVKEFDDAPEFDEFFRAIVRNCPEEMIEFLKSECQACYKWNQEYWDSEDENSYQPIIIYASRNNLPDCFSELEYIRKYPNNDKIWHEETHPYEEFLKRKKKEAEACIK